MDILIPPWVASEAPGPLLEEADAGGVLTLPIAGVGVTAENSFCFVVVAELVDGYCCRPPPAAP